MILMIQMLKQLGLSWSFETGTNRGHETTPIVVDGMMFITAPWSVVFALDAKTGKANLVI